MFNNGGYCYMGEIFVWAIIVTAVSICLLLVLRNNRAKSAGEPVEMMGIIGITIVGVPLLTYVLISWIQMEYLSTMNDLVFILIIFISFAIAYKLAFWLSNRHDY